MTKQMLTHEDQKRFWDDEHKKPQVLVQMDSEEASSGVTELWKWLEQQGITVKTVLEMGCGKGRNIIWLAKQGMEATGFDFSDAAIKEAKERAQESKTSNANFLVHDATKRFPFDDSSFDLVIDCFASTDIESEQGRNFARQEMERVLKPGGYYFVYLLSTEDEFHKQMIEFSPAHDKNSFVHNTGKFEKVFDEQEIKSIYKDLKVVAMKRMEKVANFFGKDYNCKHFWIIFQNEVIGHES